MSTLHNVNSVANAKQGEFKPAAERTGPIEKRGHQPGRKVAPSDFVPEFHAESYPPGTAPASSSYRPNPVNEVGGQALNPNVERAHGKESVKTSAADTLIGATSQDVYTGLGHPGSGQTSQELHHDGQAGRKGQSAGLEQVGAFQTGKYERQIPSQRGLERDEARPGQRGDKGALSAEDRIPEPAETAAAEWKYEPSTKRD
ncbi:hypothetical protein BO70DRAFT_358927 [Aspergillus heteromorphus CBS 117.55]|uniref:Uncharacterized protein n=1 Tax=Aspergillus heteromorphus CBS 117.55 TaxID=1448321 RepID=A0A317WU19_9EURO|nr:uncharacterized protein BO70DRAFT_358927 [Aspergillus heteromorphus CBS 117.55]PWY89913.1 hypothetical protein BO70DRAFT_358927 [Aspergillus heteromorphus CBS 117.55]